MSAPRVALFDKYMIQMTEWVPVHAVDTFHRTLTYEFTGHLTREGTATFYRTRNGVAETVWDLECRVAIRLTNDPVSLTLHGWDSNDERKLKSWMDK